LLLVKEISVATHCTADIAPEIGAGVAVGAGQE